MVIKDLAKALQLVTVGTQGTSKTTFLSAFDLFCTDLSVEKRNEFRYAFYEFGVKPNVFQGLKVAQSRLLQGKFPEKTPKGQAYEGFAELSFKTTFGWLDLLITAIEISGEDMADLVGRWGASQYSVTSKVLSEKEASMLSTKVLNSDGFIYCTPVTRAITEDGTLGREREPDDLPDNPDLNLYRFTQEMWLYKHRTRGARKLRAIYFLATKYDSMMSRLQAAGYDLETPEGMDAFMARFYPNTWGLMLKYDIKVRCYPFWVWCQKDAKGEPINYAEESGAHEYKVVVDPSNGRPYYSERWILKMLNDLKEDFLS